MDRLRALCQQKLTDLGLIHYQDRLEQELQEIEAQKEQEYFLHLYDQKLQFSENENNLAVVFLLGLVKQVNWERPPEYTVPEWPDVDVDYLPEVRNYLKEQYAPSLFGEDYVCNIGAYNTYGIKSALIDMTRVFGGDRNEILSITTKIGLKDDEGAPISWEKAMELYPELKAWERRNHPIAEAAKALLYADIDWGKYDYKGEPPHRNRSMGMHAGGLIISGVPISDNMPLVRGKDGLRASAWGEGLHSQDLSYVGYVKYDYLVIDALQKIACCIEWIRKRHGIAKVSALPGKGSWSDLSYLDDPAMLAAANAGDLKMVFQYDSDGIRNLAMNGGVTAFDDLVAYSALYRPGPMDVGMHESYCHRKRGREKYTIPKGCEEFLAGTYGVLVYQEQVMQLLHVAGEIPLKDCQSIIKAISKKNKEKLEKFEEVFVRNAQKTLSITELKAKELFAQIVSFGGYGFNKSIDENTLIPLVDGSPKPIRDIRPGDKVYTVDEDGLTQETTVLARHDHGVLDGFEVVFDDEYSLICSIHHKFLTADGQVALHEIIAAGLSVSAKDLTSRRIVRVMSAGKRRMYDIEVSSSTHNFLLPNGIITSNSHAVAYSYLTARTLWLKVHYPLEFYCAVLSSLPTGDDRLQEYRRDGLKHGIAIERADINRSKESFEIVGDKIYWGLSAIKGIGDKPAAKIVQGQPYKDFKDFLDRFGTSGSVLKPLMGLGIFPEQSAIGLYRHYVGVKDYAKKTADRAKRHQTTKQKYYQQLNDLLDLNASEVPWDVLEETANHKGVLSDFLKIKNKLQRSIESFQSKGRKGVGEEVDDKLLNKELLEVFSDRDKAEIAFYGFIWNHPLERHRCYSGLTFDRFRKEIASGFRHFPVEVLIRACRKLKSKKNTSYYQLEVEDASGDVQRINIWNNDYVLYSNDFRKGNMVRLNLAPPSGGFRTFSLESYPRWHKVDKETDGRVYLFENN